MMKHRDHMMKPSEMDKMMKKGKAPMKSAKRSAKGKAKKGR